MHAKTDSNHEHTESYNCSPCAYVTCKFCETSVPSDDAHSHDAGWVCEDCWDERLRVTE